MKETVGPGETLVKDGVNSLLSSSKEWVDGGERKEKWLKNDVDSLICASAVTVHLGNL